MVHLLKLTFPAQRSIATFFQNKHRKKDNYSGASAREARQRSTMGKRNW